jgi:hypothetical protein
MATNKMPLLVDVLEVVHDLIVIDTTVCEMLRLERCSISIAKKTMRTIVTVDEESTLHTVSIEQVDNF